MRALPESLRCARLDTLCGILIAEIRPRLRPSLWKLKTSANVVRSVHQLAENSETVLLES